MILLGGPYDQKFLERTGMLRGDHIRISDEVYLVESPDVLRWCPEGNDDPAWSDFADRLISKRPDFPRSPR